jgi:raffinose/stachyose/melibiose transport system permease protein
MEKTSKPFRIIGFWALLVVSVIYLVPLLLILMNSFKSNLFITNTPFQFPNAENSVGGTNYSDGLIRTGFLSAFGVSAFITVASVFVIVLVTSMTAWYIARVKSWFTTLLYYLFVFSMIVPFQMVMFTMSKVANMAHLDNPVGIVFLYTGFGAGLSVFIFTGFIRSIPIELEEAAMIDGASPWKVFFSVIFPVLKPTAITIAILNAMWVWNDYLLPFLVIGNSPNKTLVLALYFARILAGQYGNPWQLIFPAVFITTIPIVIVFLCLQKYIVKGISAGAIKS